MEEQEQPFLSGTYKPKMVIAFPLSHLTRLSRPVYFWDQPEPPDATSVAWSAAVA